VDSSQRITPEHEISLIKLIRNNVLDELKDAFALWLSKTVMELIEKYTGIAMLIRTACEYHKRWIYTPENPKANLERNTMVV
jgi:hypothetical protein